MNKTRLISILISSLLIFSFSIIVLMNAYDVKDVFASENSNNVNSIKTNPVPDGYVEVTSNDHLILYLNRNTTSVAVKNKTSGKIWHSNPVDGSQDPLASGHGRALLNSQLAISYHTHLGQLLHMNSYFDSVRHGQFTIEEISNGIKVVYRIGQEERLFLLPLAISQQRMEDMILANLPEASHRSILRNYRLVVLEEITDESRRQNLLELHPSLAETPLYLLNENVADFMKESMEELVIESGYTFEKLNEDHALNNVPLLEQRRDIFIIPIEYTLENDNLVVRIPTEEIIYHPSYPLHSVRVLEFFGAADINAEGYIFVPDGSGALINLNNNKHRFQPFSLDVYGKDKSIPLRSLPELTGQAFLPVFGLKNEDNAFFTIIEDGEGLARIWADVSRRINSFNSVFAEFTTVPSDVLDMGVLSGLNVIYVHQPRIFKGDIALRFAFLHGENANYVGMAHYYQNYLVEKYNLDRPDVQENLPFVLELLGAVNIRRPFLGVPLNQIEALTTFDQSVNILRNLLDSGVRNVDLIMSGWFNGGLTHSIPTRINHIRALGGSAGFKRLADFAYVNQIDFSPEMNLLFVESDTFFDGFNPRNHASRLISRPIARLLGFNVSTLQPDDESTARFVLSPERVPYVTSRIIENFDRLPVSGIAFSDVGTYVNSDFRENGLIDRQQASKIIKDAMEKVDASGLDVTLRGGNANVLPFARRILEIPLKSNFFEITDHSIPFFQIAIRGFIEFAGNPINFSGNPRADLLRAIETGSGLYFKWMYSDNSVVKRTRYDDLFSANYLNWFDFAIEKYNVANEVLADVQGQRIIGHGILSTGVHKTTFENGMQVIVNYNRNKVSAIGLTIDAESFRVVREGE